uniref:Uncharacterized protein n=1 Tax=Vespula pensylvanica TaxID=30213 RepID=A0A834P3C2_VESPE|nr:hypothetical protein H0235_006610 [Vespula pensylvanica]
MRDITLYLRELFVNALTDGFLRKLLFSLVKVQSITELLTIKVGQRHNFVVVSRSRASPLCIFLVERQSTTVKVDQRSDFVVATGGRVSPLHNFILKQNKSCRILRE